MTRPKRGFCQRRLRRQAGGSKTGPILVFPLSANLFFIGFWGMKSLAIAPV
jgi:hypothetical protein